MTDPRVDAKLEFMSRAVAAARQQLDIHRRFDAKTDDGPGEETLRAAVLSGIKYELQTGIQAMIDVAYHLCARALRLGPKDAYDAFERLVSAGVLPRARLVTYRRIIGFRNRVVHGYDDLDTALVLQYAERTADFAAFRAEIEAFTASAPDPDPTGPARPTDRPPGEQDG